MLLAPSPNFATMQELWCNVDSCFLCRHCLPEWKSLVAIHKKTVLFKKGKKIFQEGDSVEGIYFIYEGSVKVTMNWDGQKELLLRFAKAGDVLGHRGFGGNRKYPISATAMEDCKVCFIDNSFLETSLTANTALTYQMMQLYASELQKAEERMRNLAHREVKGRIALALLEIADVFGIGKDQFITVPITRQDIASYAGTTYETVFKFFTELSNSNILSTEGKNLKINDREALLSFLTGQNKTGPKTQ
jgi:CRP-like cAMP-binding protein